MGPQLATISLVLLTLLVNTQQSPYSSPNTECPSYFNGSIAGNSCSQEYYLCENGVRQAAKCTDGYVFYETGCIPIEDSPECEVNDDTEDEPSTSFDCTSQNDGIYSLGCVNQFVKCVAGHAYTMYCPADLVYSAKTNECLESCDQEAADETTTVAYLNEDDEVYDEAIGYPTSTDGFNEPAQPTTEQPEPIGFDCTGREDGFYADGCSQVFFACSNNIAFKKLCPSGTVYNPSQKACDYDCVPVTTTQSYEPSTDADVSSTTTQSYEPSTDADVPSTTTPSYEPSTDADVPSSTTQSYEPSTDADVPTTTEAVTIPVYTTTPQEDVPSTTTDAPVYSTTPQDDEPVTTTTPFVPVYTTAPQDDEPSTTRAPIQVCTEGEVTTFGTCSSRFNRCQNNAVRSKQCPVNTLFEASLLLCVFDLPQCQPITTPVVYPTYPQPDVVVSPFDENVRLVPKFDRRPKYQHNVPIYDNPFFVPPHHSNHRRRGDRNRRYRPAVVSPFSTNTHGRAILDDEFKDYRRARMDKLNYGEARRVEGNKRFIIDDEFEGPKARFITTDIDRVFPRVHTNRQLGPRYDPDGYEDGSGFDPKDLFGATRKKRSTYYGVQQPGYGQQTQISARQAQVNKDCQSYTVPTFLTFGNCFGQFIYCSGNGVNRMAACPIGESFDKSIGACSETCGVTTPIVTVTDAPVSTGTQTGTIGDDTSVFTSSAPSSYESYTTIAPYTTSGPASDDSSDYGYTTGPAQEQPSTTPGYGYSTGPADDQPTVTYPTTKAPIGERCHHVSSGLFAIGCSQKYIQCDNGAAIVRMCSATLYFNEAKSVCDYRDQVPECQEQDTPSEYVPTLPGDDKPSSNYDYTTGPSAEQPSTTYGYATGPAQEQPSTTSGYGYPNVPTASPGYGTTTGPAQEEPSTTSGYGYPNVPTASPGYGTTTGPAQEQPSTTSEYGYPAGPSDDESSYGFSNEPSQEEPSTYSPVVSPYRPPVVDKCFGRDDGVHGEACSSSYFICSGGRVVKVFTCALGEGYDPSVRSCRTFNLIPSEQCGQVEVETTTDIGLSQTLPYLTLEDVLTSTVPSTTTVGNDVPSDDSYGTTTASSYETASDEPYGSDSYTTEEITTTTASVYERVADEEDDEPVEEQKCTLGSRASVGFCVQKYLECGPEGYVEKSCKVGKLFDSHGKKCIPRIACGKDAIREAVQDIIATTQPTVPPKKIDGRCAHIEGEAVFALGMCSSRYVRCSYGTAKLEICPRTEVFSNAVSTCVSRASSSECIVAQDKPVRSYYNNNQQSAYCDGKVDGLYGNKKDCSAILQCFGGELFEHPSCPASLAFNELTGKCDYPQKVSGCENHGQTDGVCSEHGSFIADVDNCKVFYRCVWGRKVTMKCPSGTAFNPALSVCDWPANVKSCSPAASDDEYATTGSPYGNNNSGY